MFGKNQVDGYFKYVYILVIIFLIRAVYRAFFIKLRKPEDYIIRAKYWVSYFGARKKAIKTLEEGLELPGLDQIDRDRLNLCIGNEYYFKKDFENAVVYFDKINTLFYQKGLLFDKSYLNVIMSYYNVGRKNDARKLYHTLRKNEKFDPKYGYLQSLDMRIFK